MGFRQAVVLASSSFFLGVLFICLNIDHRILWIPLTEENVERAYAFYAVFHNAPVAVRTLMHSMMAVGFLALLSKLFKWDESAMFFDGSSTAAYMFSIVIYFTVTVPGLRTIVLTPANAEEVRDKLEALRVLCAGNNLIALCLIGVLCLQAGQEYATRLEKRELARIEAEEATQKLDKSE